MREPICCRTCVTLGAAGCGIAAAPLLDALRSVARGRRCAGAGVWRCRRAGAVALDATRASGSAKGLGFGDVKLAAAVGAWLPLDAIPSVLRPCGERGAGRGDGGSFARPTVERDDEAAVRRLPLSVALVGILCKRLPV